MNSFDIKLPSINAPTDSGRIEQIKGYLQQLAEQLKWALNSLDSSGLAVLQQSSKSTSSSTPEDDAVATFNSVKSLIIKSADIVDAYYEVIRERLSGEYVAQSEFGTYTEHTTNTITTDSKAVENLYTNIREIVSNIENLDRRLIEVNANVRSGLLYTDDNGVPIYGFEVGQKNNIDGVEVFNKFARFTSDRLSFYDKNDTEIAYISDYKLYITNAHITGILVLRRWILDPSNGLAFKWV